MNDTLTSPAVMFVREFGPLAGGFATLAAVWINLFITGRRADGERRRNHAAAVAERERLLAATEEQFLGLARVVRNRLSVTYLAAGRPIEGFGTFERLLDLAYSGPMATLTAERRTSDAFFGELGSFEQALGSMRHCLERLRVEGAVVSAVDERRLGAIAAARAAAQNVDHMRAMFGDEKPVADVQFTAAELAPPGTTCSQTATPVSIVDRPVTPEISENEAYALIATKFQEVDANWQRFVGCRLTKRGKLFDAYVINTGRLRAEFETATISALGPNAGAIRVEW